MSLLPSLVFSLRSPPFCSFFPLTCTPPKYLEYKSYLACCSTLLPPSSPLPLCTFRPLLLSFLAILHSVGVCVLFFLLVSSQLIEHGMLCSLSSEGIGEGRGGAANRLAHWWGGGGSAVVPKALIGWGKGLQKGEEVWVATSPPTCSCFDCSAEVENTH